MEDSKLRQFPENTHSVQKPTWEPRVRHSLSYVSLVFKYLEEGLFSPLTGLDEFEANSFSYL